MNISIDINESLKKAIEKKDIPQIIHCVKRNANVNLKIKNGVTLLHLAAFEKDMIYLAKLIISKGANIESALFDGATPLYIAAQEGNEEMVRLLLKNNANFNVKVKKAEYTPLHVAVEEGHYEAAEALLLGGANVNAELKNGYTSLHLAAERGNAKMTYILIKFGANIHAVTTDRAYINRESKTNTLVNALVNSGMNVSFEKKCTPLHLAAINGFIEAIIILLDSNADINAKTENGSTPLMMVDKRNKEVIDLLNKRGAKQNNSQNIIYAANDIKIYRLDNNNDDEKLRKAAEEENFEEVERLIKSNINVNSAREDGSTALHLVSRNNNIKILKLLLENKANVDAITKKTNATPLHWAAKFGAVEAAKILIENGANVNSCTKNGLSALHLAAKGDHVRIVELLYNNKDLIFFDFNIVLKVARENNSRKVLEWAQKRK